MSGEKQHWVSFKPSQKDKYVVFIAPNQIPASKQINRQKATIRGNETCVAWDLRESYTFGRMCICGVCMWGECMSVKLGTYVCVCAHRGRKEDIRYLHLVLLKQGLMEPEAKLLVNNCCLCPTPHPNRAGMFGRFLTSHGSWDAKLGSYAYTTSSLAESLLRS